MRVMDHHFWQRNSCSDTTHYEIAKLPFLYISLQKGSATMWWPFVSKYRADPRFDATFMDVALCPAILAESKLSEFFRPYCWCLNKFVKWRPPIATVALQVSLSSFLSFVPPILYRSQWVLLIKPKPITTLLSRLQMSQYMGCLFIIQSLRKIPLKRLLVKSRADHHLSLT